MFSVSIIMEIQISIFWTVLLLKCKTMYVDTGLLWLHFRKWTASLQMMWQAEKWKSLDFSQFNFHTFCLFECVTDWVDVFVTVYLLWWLHMYTRISLWYYDIIMLSMSFHLTVWLSLPVSSHSAFSTSPLPFAKLYKLACIWLSLYCLPHHIYSIALV